MGLTHCLPWCRRGATSPFLLSSVRYERNRRDPRSRNIQSGNPLSPTSRKSDTWRGAPSASKQGGVLALTVCRLAFSSNPRRGEKHRVLFGNPAVNAAHDVPKNMVRFEKRKSIAAFSWLTFFINSAVMQNQVSDSPLKKTKMEIAKRLTKDHWYLLAVRVAAS